MQRMCHSGEDAQCSNTWLEHPGWLRCAVHQQPQHQDATTTVAHPLPSSLPRQTETVEVRKKVCEEHLRPRPVSLN